MNKKTNGLMAKLGLLAMVAGGLAMTGCSSTKGLDTLHVEQQIKSKDGIIYGIKGGTKSVASICEAFANTNDERCKNQDDFQAINVLVVDFRLVPKAPYGLVAFVPKSVGEIPHTGIVKLRLDGFRPAYFEGLVAPYHNADKECYYSNSAAHSGVVCPKHNWDYRKDLNL